MSADALLSKLDKVRRSGVDRWIARCPGHEDGRPSLAIRELDDGRILVHCFAGCSVEAVLDAIGMELTDLFPDKPLEHGRRERRPFNAYDVLACIEAEVLIVATAACNIGNGFPLLALDRERLLLAAERLQSAVSLANGRR